MISAARAQLDDFLHPSAQCPWRMPPPSSTQSTAASLGLGEAEAASCCARLSSSALTPGQMLGPATGALNWGCTHFLALEVLAQPCLLFSFTSPGAQHFRLPPGTYKGQAQQNRAGIGISLAAGAQQEEFSPSAQRRILQAETLQARSGRGNVHGSGYQHPSAEFSHSQG